MTMSSYWLNEAQQLDHQALAEMTARIFNLRLEQVAFCTTASLREAIVKCNARYLRVRGWK